MCVCRKNCSLSCLNFTYVLQQFPERQQKCDLPVLAYFHSACRLETPLSTRRRGLHAPLPRRPRLPFPLACLPIPLPKARLVRRGGGVKGVWRVEPEVERHVPILRGHGRHLPTLGATRRRSSHEPRGYVFSFCTFPPCFATSLPPPYVSTKFPTIRLRLALVSQRVFCHHRGFLLAPSKFIAPPFSSFARLLRSSMASCCLLSRS